MNINLNGSVISRDTACLPLTDRGLLLGDGLFETLYYNGEYLDEGWAHWRRLQKGLTLLEIPFRETFETIRHHTMALLEANGLIKTTAAVRLTITRGVGGRGLQIPGVSLPVWFIQATAYHRSSHPLRLDFSKHRHPGRTPLSSIKHLGYQLSILGRLEARQKKIEDVLFVNKGEEVVGATAANVFVIINGTFVTPPLSAGCLPGIKRAQVIKSFKNKGIKIAIRPLLRYEVQEKATAIFLTNSLIGMQKVSHIGNRALSI